MKGHRGTCTDFFQFCYLHCFWSIPRFFVGRNSWNPKEVTFSWIRNDKSSKSNQNIWRTLQKTFLDNYCNDMVMFL